MTATRIEVEGGIVFRIPLEPDVVIESITSGKALPATQQETPDPVLDTTLDLGGRGGMEDELRDPDGF